MEIQPTALCYTVCEGCVGFGEVLAGDHTQGAVLDDARTNLKRDLIWHLLSHGFRLLGGANVLLGTTLAITGCKAPVRSPEWDLIRTQPIHDASPAGSTQLGRSTHAPRKVFLPGAGENEGWFETVHASPLPPRETLAWYAERFSARYHMSQTSYDDRVILQGRLAGAKPITITVQVSESRPLYGNILGRFPDGPPGTKSYVFIWAATH